MESVFKTDCGKVRSHNEDSGGVFLNKNNDILAVVADGMGGHSAGDVASALTVEFLREKWEEQSGAFTEQRARQWCKEMVKDVNTHLLSYAEEHPECRGMGTTLVMALCTDSFTVVSNVGDSRCYLLSDETFDQVTNDHTLVGELVRKGQLTEEEAAFHPRKHVIMQAIGTETEVEAEIEVCHPGAGQSLLLCSDGLSNKVTDEQLEEVLRLDTSLNDKGEQLVNMANDAGGEDNITLAILNFEADEQMKQAGDGTHAG